MPTGKTTPRRPRLPGILSQPIRAWKLKPEAKRTQLIEAERSRRFGALLDHFEIDPNDPDAGPLLLQKMAERHYPGLTVRYSATGGKPPSILADRIAARRYDQLFRDTKTKRAPPGSTWNSITLRKLLREMTDRKNDKFRGTRPNSTRALARMVARGKQRREEVKAQRLANWRILPGESLGWFLWVRPRLVTNPTTWMAWELSRRRRRQKALAAAAESLGPRETAHVVAFPDEAARRTR